MHETQLNAARAPGYTTTKPSRFGIRTRASVRAFSWQAPERGNFLGDRRHDGLLLSLNRS